MTDQCEEKLTPVVDLVGDLCNGNITAERFAELDRLLRTDDDSVQVYVEYLALEAEFILYTRRERPNAAETLSLEVESGIKVESEESQVAPLRPAVIPPPSPSPPLNLLSTAYHGTVEFFSQEMPFGILMATLFMIVGGIIGLNVTKEHYTQMPGRSSSSAERTFAAADEAGKARAAAKEQENVQWVGRITSMVDCKWSNDKDFLPPGGDYVSLGRKYKLDSGLMEITYYSGAKVILQGPCTYEVDSAAGGYLSLGRLTARVENKGAEDAVASGQWLVASESTGEAVDSGEWPVASESTESRNPQIPKSPNSSSPAPRPTSHAPLFAVRTPTAIVTDLGTEFGVEVEKTGNTKSHVFQGRVVFVALAANGEKPGGETVLDANQSACTETKDGAVRVVVASDGKLKPDDFVRREQLVAKIKENRELPYRPFRQWQAHSQELRRDPSLVAYYDFQRIKDNLSRLENVATNAAGSRNGLVEFASWVNGRTAGKHALSFNYIDDRVEVDFPQSLDDLTLAAWARLEKFSKPSVQEFGFSSLLMSNGWNQPGLVHWLIRSDGRMGFVLADGLFFYQAKPSFTPERMNRWTHLAVVYDHGAAKAALYVDGRATDETAIATHAPIRIGPACIGNWKGLEAGRNFLGRIDEMAIFNRPLTAKEIQDMFEAGKPADNSETDKQTESK